MRRPRFPLLLALLPALAPGATGGPDGGGMLYADSDEPDGPPFGWLDTSGGQVHSLGDDDIAAVDLPFELSWYGDSYDSAWISSNGALFFEGETDSGTPSCPATGDSWAGVVPFWDDLAGGTVRSQSFGQYPYRCVAVEWDGVSHASHGGSGSFQLWLLEHASEAVILLEDVSFGHAAVDGGAGATVGVQGAGGDGLAWSCSGGLADGTAAWFHLSGDRPSTATVPTESVGWAFSGDTAWSYAGGALAGGELNGDGLSDLLVGNAEADTGVAWLIHGGTPSGALSDAAIGLYGEASGDQAGAALALGDLDGDGIDEIVVGAPEHDGAGTHAGAVYVLQGSGVSGVLSLADADWIADGPSGSGRALLGAGLAMPGDVDGDGYPDLLVGAPNDDKAATNDGAAYLFSGSAGFSGATDVSAAQASFTGTHTAEAVGYALAGADLDADGLSELVFGSPNANIAAAGAGAVYLVEGGSWSSSNQLDTVAGSILLGEVAYDEAGSAVLLADLDGSGVPDLVLGAPGSDVGGSDSGLAYLFFDPSPALGPVSLSTADTALLGVSTHSSLGEALAAGDLNNDGRDDLFVAAPSEDASGVSSGGIVYVFTSPPAAGEVDIVDAEHQVHGSLGGGELGSALAFLDDFDDDGYGDLALGAPLATTDAATGNGVAWVWSYFPSFADEDGDGFVALEAQAMDCDDDDAAVFPGATELVGNLVDDDCDGWVDDLLRPREVQAWWEHDLVEDWGDPAIASFDFESASSGDDVTELYGSYGVHLASRSGLVASEEVYGALPVELVAAAIGSDSATTLELSFDETVDAIGLRLLDASCELELEGSGGGTTLFSGWSVEIEADDRRGGQFLGLELAEPIDTLSLACSSGDGWGVDDLQVVWSSLTDADADGYTEADGDCDDGDASVNPGASETLGNGVDDDCDGIVDAGGATTYDGFADWQVDAALDEVTVDFEELELGSLDSEAYLELGLSTSADAEVVADVDGSAARDDQAAQVAIDASYDSITLRFAEAQPALALWLLDCEAELSYEASWNGSSLYGGTVDRIADDVAGGAFLGFVFDTNVDELTLSAGSYGDSFGLDDLTFSTLGLDDADGDGLTERDGDCDDDDPDVHPGAEETYYDGVDQDCDGASDYDADGDGHESTIDCDDSDPDVHPDAEETYYDGVDQDCDGWSDYDADMDGHDLDRDCDDEDASINPDAEEIHYDGIDSNCVESDEYDADGDGYSVTGGGLSGSVGTGDCDDEDASVSPGAAETWYDGVDQDCDEESDYDADLDGHDSHLYGGDDCDDTDDSVNPGVESDACYDGLDADCNGQSDYDCDGDGWDHEAWATGTGDCDDLDPSIHPGASEILGDGIDQDCDGGNDYDGDGDGFEGSAWGGSDCDDADPTVSPDGEEACGDGVDQDCDGYDDHDCDGDGYEATTRGGTDCDDADATIHPDALDACYDGLDADCGEDSDHDCDGDGHEAVSAGGLDCDDTDSGVHPEAYDHPYDGVDQDCDGADDFDADGDGYTVDFYGGADCDDGDASIHPGAPDPCYDGVDSDCGGEDDHDCDGDGHASDAHGGDDCDDDDDAISPGAEEICADGVDQDCDGSDSCLDADEDGYPDASQGGSDCDDADASVHPGAEELCYDGVDSDCSGHDDADCDQDGHVAQEHGGDDCDDEDPEVSPSASETWYDGVDQDCDGGDDYDQDGDGYAADIWGGGDCDDADPDRNPGVGMDDCGGGDEDCDDEVDEDCEPTVDTGPWDTGTPPEDTAPPEDTGDSGSPEDSGDTGPFYDTGPSLDTAEPEEDGPGSPWQLDDGCGGCNANAAPALLWSLLLWPLVAQRRRRGRRSAAARPPAGTTSA